MCTALVIVQFACASLTKKFIVHSNKKITSVNENSQELSLTDKFRYTGANYSCILLQCSVALWVIFVSKCNYTSCFFFQHDVVTYQ